MATVAELVFTGICAFIAADPGTSRPFAAVFPNGSGHDPAHGVWLLIEKSAGWEFTSTASSRIEAPPGTSCRNGDYWFVRIVDESITMDNLESGQQLDFDDTNVFYRRKPVRQTDAPALHWLPRMKSVWPQQTALVDDAKKTPANGDVVRARMIIPVGKLRTGYVEDAVWQITPRKGVHLPWERSMAEEINLSVRFKDDIVLKATKYDGSATTTFRLHCTASCTEPPPITIGNTPDDDVLPAIDPTPQTDPHFALYYMLFTPPAGTFEPPIPKRVERPASAFRSTPPPSMMRLRANLCPLRVSGGNCPPVLVQE